MYGTLLRYIRIWGTDKKRVRYTDLLSEGSKEHAYSTLVVPAKLLISRTAERERASQMRGMMICVIKNVPLIQLEYMKIAKKKTTVSVHHTFSKT